MVDLLFFFNWNMRLDISSPDSLGALYVDQASLEKGIGVGFLLLGGQEGVPHFEALTT